MSRARSRRRPPGDRVRPRGRPRAVTVHLRDADGIWLRVIDDGRGFDPSNPGTSFGLKERTESLGGQFRLTSGRGRGTSVEILLP